MPRLLVESEALRDRVYEFEGSAVVGRSPDADVRLADFTISRLHARMSPDQGGYTIEDLGSSNGTFLNGEPVTASTAVQHGDTIQLGRVVLSFGRLQREGDRSDSVSRVHFDEHSQPARIQEIDASSAASLLTADHGADATSLERRLQLLFDVTKAIGGTLDEEELLSLILRKLFQSLPQAGRGTILLLDDDGEKLIPRLALDRSGEPTEIAVSRTLVREVIENRRGILSADAAEDDRFAASQTLHTHQIHSVLCVPIMTEEKAFGVLQLDGAPSAPVFDRQDMALVSAIANQAALFLANARLHAELMQRELLEKDLALASKIQHSFLPKRPPRRPPYEFAVSYRPALGIGGDYYDFLDLVDGRLGIVVGDVSGKGLSAALYMARLSSEVRYRSSGLSDPAQILERVNDSLCQDLEQGMFVTLTMLVLDSESGACELVDAGHPPPLIRHAGAVRRLLDAPDPALGLESGIRFTTHRHTVTAGDSILIYSDGVTEALRADGSQYGEERLTAAFESAGRISELIVDGVLSSVHTFTAGAPRADDLTLLCLSLT